MQKISNLIGYVITAYCALGALAITLMMLHIAADVISTFVFNRPLPGTIPIVSQYYMVIATFLPLAFVERKAGHVSVEILVQRFPKKVQGALAAAAIVLGVVIFSLITWRAWLEAMKKHAIGTFSYEEAFKIPTWPSYYILPLGTGLMTVVMLYKLARYFIGGKDTYPTDAF
ncbi:TRAP transporter small permease [Profundibacter sp.]